ncbi:hypothetical protein AOLI_G00298200 [Acnodon oligacanthus]
MDNYKIFRSTLLSYSSYAGLQNSNNSSEDYEKMYGTLIFLLLLGSSSLTGVSAFSNGAVIQSCDGMTPGHGSNTAMSVPPPFLVISDNSTYTADQEITVTLQANETAFKGFMLQARDAVTGDRLLGMFSVMESEGQLLYCEGKATAVSHISSADKKSVQAKWIPHSSETRDIEFRATFVRSFNEFWVGVRSSRIMFAGMIPNSTMAPNSTVMSTLKATLAMTPNGSPSLSYSLSLLVLPLVLLAFPSKH